MRCRPSWVKNPFLLLAILSMGTTTARATLITNGNFETVPSGATGQNLMPTDWVAAPGTSPDTYSNDGSYGLTPSGFGNFPGVTAHEGIRWVAGWSLLPEDFGQFLASPLVAGNDYELSGWMHQALRTDLDNPGGYNVYMTDTPGVLTEFLGFLGPTTSVAAGWQLHSFSFNATPAMASLSFIEFSPVKMAEGESYPGLDLVSLDVVSEQPVPAPGTLGLVSMILVLQFVRRKP